ncbi:MAG: hypothetical protein AB7E30_06850 [Lawsonibacter sp.]
MKRQRAAGYSLNEFMEKAMDKLTEEILEQIDQGKTESEKE